LNYVSINNTAYGYQSKFTGTVYFSCAKFVCVVPGFQILTVCADECRTEAWPRSIWRRSSCIGVRH